MTESVIHKGGRRHGGVSAAIKGSVTLPMFLFPALLFTLLLVGCGTSEKSSEFSSTPAQIDSQPIVEVGAGPVEAETLTAGDLALDEGSISIFYSNSTRSDVQVSFDLEGPWDFTEGPDAFTLTMENVNAADAPFAEDFPDAAVAVYSSWTPALIEPMYSFQNVDSGAWRAFGDASETRIVSFSGPSRVLLFPARVGDEWTDTYTRTEDDEETEIVAENRIVSYNRLEVPAGEYDAFLLQTRITATSNRKSVTTWDYTWIVPGIGRAAEIVSMPDEEDEVFDRAYSFYRLESTSSA